ncbi:VPS9 domain-containing protein, putative [Hepatocystis sp. ex Piliocolobus tephrosceles]|nr:VPS9 domain-containing protein, putative [Hepatocystis sp. ex Piliocolobus tephrosceles]
MAMDNHHPVLNILLSKYKTFHNKLSNRKHIILLPEAKTLLNINIDINFIKKYIFLKSPLKNIYVNLVDQCIEIDSKFIYTDYGFEISRICEIIKIDTNFNYNFLKIIFINIPLEGDYEGNDTLLNYNEDIGQDFLESQNDLNLFFNNNQKCNEFLYLQILQFINSYIIVKGCESYIGKKIATIIDDTLKLQNNTNEKLFKNDIRLSLIKYTYSHLYNIIWKKLSKNYKNMELKIQEKMRYIKKNINTFLNKFSIDYISLLNIETISFHIKQIEKCINPIDKINILDNVSKIICEIILCTNQDLKQRNLSIYDITSDTLISIFVAAISYGQIQNIISHSIHLHMYIDNLTVSEKIDKLSFIFTIFHSSIIYLCDVKIA